MKNKKRAIKTTAVIIGSGIVLTGVGLLSYVGLGQMFVECHHDPEHWLRGILNSSRYGWSLMLKDGWAA